jgi:hypothetical protein
MGCECLTGLGVLEKCADQKAAETRAATFGWKPEERLDVVVEVESVKVI